MRKKNLVALAGMLSACLLCGTAVTARAYTADDVAQKARDAGWPEYLIQSGYNEWASGAYSQEDLAQAYASVQSYDSQTEEMICNAFGVEYQPGNSSDVPAESESSTETDTGDAGNQPAATGDGATDAGTADSSAFINMTLDEKIDYVNSLEESQKSSFLSGLSREERNSIIKQLPTEQKAALMQNYIDTASSMGMNVVVDSLTEDSISVTVRNEAGVIIDKAGVGVVIDETGISHTKPLLVAAAGILGSVAGFALLYWYGKKTENSES